jgi:hypothetical protein
MRKLMIPMLRKRIIRMKETIEGLKRLFMIVSTLIRSTKNSLISILVRIRLLKLFKAPRTSELR